MQFSSIRTSTRTNLLLLIIVSTILKFSTAFTAWEIFAGIMMLSPVSSKNDFPPIIISPLHPLPE